MVLYLAIGKLKSGRLILAMFRWIQHTSWACIQESIKYAHDFLHEDLIYFIYAYICSFKKKWTEENAIMI